MSKVTIKEKERARVKHGDFLLVNVEGKSNLLVKYINTNGSDMGGDIVSMEGTSSWSFSALTETSGKNGENIFVGRKYRNCFGTIIEVLSIVDVTIMIDRIII